MRINDYTIRKATTEDIAGTLAMKLAAWRETYADQRPESFFEAEEARREAQIDWWTRGLAAGADLWIATAPDGRVVGCAGGAPVHDEDAPTGAVAELQMLYVLAEAHGTGLGAGLMRATIGNLPAVVWILEHNPRAQAFYRKHGFDFDGARELLADEWAGLDEVRMVRPGPRG
ncbi:MAG: GNAT family N-acetyltransferase [Arthrobacter sp.]|uniref:GNAT family N-acetyltransferase n=1 Tax=unclassified Arthrobacter TaxID=235627 RepID=UPI002653D5AF|nr:GNAT family N-acetyltransferase [Micrococcaceae bacterium]MDN5813885.1 GNAT family N-acetyltransferase [Micrococcaceae bacterium]MDN5824032.1 GNAT family N-acetyltransferase [Micrococcaceae bacterium]MDN5877997.1 GNAT family N-acetyltransferase [Micrococcaceae bacterium]MDN5885491.1 GNAT family N-acetyltransferase [Micrococcaceae bacterium]